MNQQQTTQQNSPLVKADHPDNKATFREIAVSRTAGGGGLIVMNTFGEVVQFADLMSRSGHAIPEHLRNNTGACMAVTLLAMRLEIDPFLLASKSYQTKSGATIAYEAQVFAALVNTRAPIKRRPEYEYEGEGDKLRCTVSAEMLDGSVKRYKSPELGKIPVRNSPLWKGDPEQQIGYYSIRAWARRYCPEICMGIYTPDEIKYAPRMGADEARDVTPATTQQRPVANRGRMTDRLDVLSQAPATQPVEGGDEQTTDEEHEDVTAPSDFVAGTAAAGGDHGDEESPHDSVTGEIADERTPRELVVAKCTEQLRGGATWLRVRNMTPPEEMDLLTEEDRDHLAKFAEFLKAPTSKGRRAEPVDG